MKMIQKPLDTSRCGTSANAKGHRRRGEKPCPSCLKAETRAAYERKVRRLGYVPVNDSRLWMDWCRRCGGFLTRNKECNYCGKAA